MSRPRDVEPHRPTQPPPAGARRGHVFELQLGHLCNNRCVFCSSGRLTAAGDARPVPAEPLFRALDEAWAAGARRVVFVGGEPTLHRSFLPALRHAVEVGFRDIVIFTNGVTLPRPGFIESVSESGRFEWRISIQGSDEASHVAVTGRPKSYQRIMAGIDRLAEWGHRVTANVCVTRENAHSLPGYPDLVARHGITQFHVDVVRPESTGLGYPEALRQVMPRYTEIAPHLREMLRRFEARPIDAEVSVGNLPYCILPEWAGSIRHGGEATVTVASDTTALEAPVDKYAWHAGLRTQVGACQSCVFAARCQGVFRGYLDLYGDAEFRPIRLAELRALPPARRPFDLMVTCEAAEWVAAATRPPRPWALRGRASEDRSEAWTYEGPGGLVTVRLHSPEATAGRLLAPDGAPIVHRTPAFDMALVVDPPLAAEHRRSLVRFAARHLGFDATLALRRVAARHDQSLRSTQLPPSSMRPRRDR